jgi:gliding motility-associated lipoprotein GldH
LKIIRPDNTTVSDTINFYLADERGKWLGVGVGNSYAMPVLYLQNERFSQRGIYRFEIQQGMRYDALRGVSNVGLRVEKINLKQKNE